jgi:hypothetical protein
MVSQVERVYNHLQVFGFITNAQAHETYGICHLPSVIRDIKKKYNVEFEENERVTGVNRFGEKVWWDIYRLKKLPSAKGYWKG